MLIECFADPQRKPAPDGLEAMELYASADAPIPHPAKKERVAVTVRTSVADFGGGLRTYERTAQVYLCPDLTTSDGHRITLARVLADCGINPGTFVNVEVDGSVWLLPQLNPPASRRSRTSKP